MYPTLLHLVGASPSRNNLDSENIAEMLLQSAPAPQRYFYFQYRQQKAIINGDWKYVRDVIDKEYLFNVVEDQSEQKNPATILPQATIKLRNELDSFVARMHQETGEV